MSDGQPKTGLGSGTAAAAEAALVPYSAEHRDGLLRLWTRHFGRWSSERLQRRWAWQFDQNPWVAERKPVITLGIADGEVVGHISALPLPVRIDGRSQIALCASGLVADERHRWLAFRLVRSLMADPPLIATAMAAGAQKLFVRSGAALVPVSRERFMLPRRSGGALAAAVRRRVPHGLGGFVTPAAGNILSLAVRPRSRPAPRPLPPVPAGAGIRPIDRFGDEADDLWRRCSADFSLTHEKTARYLNWRYVECPTLRSVRLGLFDQGRLVGIGVGLVRTETDEALRPCERFGEIVELIADATRPGDAAALAAALARELDRHGVDAICCTGLTRSLQAFLRSQGFSPLADDSFAMAVKTATAGGAGSGSDEAVYYTSGDGDSVYSSGA